MADNDTKSGLVSGLKEMLPKLGLFGVVAIAGLVGGVVAGKVLSPAKAKATDNGPVENEDGVVELTPEQFPRPSEVLTNRTEPLDPADLAYCELEAITVTLNEPGLPRYVSMAVTLAVQKPDKTAAEEAIAACKPALVHRLTIYLAGCRLEDLRGEKNLNRVRREILDMIGSVVWPDQKALVVDVLFSRINVQ